MVRSDAFRDEIFCNIVAKTLLNYSGKCSIRVCETSFQSMAQHFDRRFQPKPVTNVNSGISGIKQYLEDCVAEWTSWVSFPDGRKRPTLF